MKLVLALFLAATCIVSTAAAQTSSGSGAAPRAQANQPQQPSAEPLPAATQTMLQKRAEDFLRKLYAWGPDFQVNAGEVKPSALPNLYEISVEVSLQGQSDSATVYVTKDGRYMFRGEIADMDVDPFAATKQKINLDGSPSKGPVDAQVVIVEFGDFQCPSCRQLDVVLRELLPQYPQVRFIFKDFPLEQIHPWAMTAALVGRCAYQQNPETFWKVHDLIYDNQEQITAENAYDKLLKLATDAGANPTELTTCVADPKTLDAVHKTMAEGANLAVEGTPTTFVNGRAITGPNQPLLRQYIQFTKQ